ncbi:hypothetical protein OG756_04390 [Streptomyces sp. NBC_01310]|uniref:hypothetical protein n=1 Tax=Streptomyces sp. NBC_01310 TaxID=2903820 RepID=UPI0035B59387|nr:hypothetical protein OG756_04390 [Streptomyces sp. NBC_01310]
MAVNIVFGLAPPPPSSGGGSRVPRGERAGPDLPALAGQREGRLLQGGGLLQQPVQVGHHLGATAYGKGVPVGEECGSSLLEEESDGAEQSGS